MDTKDFDPEELAVLRGGRKVEPVKEDALKEAKKKATTSTGKGIPPLFPIVPQEDLYKYMEEKRQPEEAFGFEKNGTFDPELNEMALAEVAAERGISVEELLSTQGKKLKKRLTPAMEDKENKVVVNAADIKKQIEQQLQGNMDNSNETESNELDLELAELELKRKEIELKRRKQMEAKANPAEPPKRVEPPKENITQKIRNPVIERMRQKLSLQSIAPAVVELEGIKFELLPPPSSIQPWMLEKVQLSFDFGDKVLMHTVRNATVCASIFKIEGVSVVEALGIAEEGSIKNPYNITFEQRVVAAQTLWEMITGVADETLFTFTPDAILKLYSAYTQAFKDLEIHSSLDPEIHRYVCEVSGCGEQYDIRPPVEGEKAVFCRAHGIPMKDAGFTKDLKSLPLV